MTSALDWPRPADTCPALLVTSPGVDENSGRGQWWPCQARQSVLRCTTSDSVIDAVWQRLYRRRQRDLLRFRTLHVLCMLCSVNRTRTTAIQQCVAVNRDCRLLWRLGPTSWTSYSLIRISYITHLTFSYTMKVCHFSHKFMLSGWRYTYMVLLNRDARGIARNLLLRTRMGSWGQKSASGSWSRTSVELRGEEINMDADSTETQWKYKAYQYWNQYNENMTRKNFAYDDGRYAPIRPWGPQSYTVPQTRSANRFAIRSKSAAWPENILFSASRRGWVRTWNDTIIFHGLSELTALVNLTLSTPGISLAPRIFSRTLQFHCTVRLLSWYVVLSVSVCNASILSQEDWLKLGSHSFHNKVA